MQPIDHAWTLLKMPAPNHYKIRKSDFPKVESDPNYNMSKPEFVAWKKAQAEALAQQQQREAAAQQSECKACDFSRKTGLTNPLWAQTCTCPPGVGYHADGSQP
tara:strand:+ start:54 stop:365 length:312 start_codon:yes stop_codon:yes gene_type:complete